MTRYVQKDKVEKLRVIIFILIAAVVVFAALCISWLVFVNTRVNPFIKEEGLEETWTEYGMTYYEYRHPDLTTSMYLDDDSDGIIGSCVVCEPRFLDFSVTINVPEISLHDMETRKSMYDYTYMFSYNYSLFGGGEYYLTVNDYTQNKEDEMNTPDGAIEFQGADVIYYLEVDKDMNLISGDKEVYDKHYDRLKEQFDVVINFFGEENFK